MAHRTLAAALATAILSLAAVDASAGPLTNSILTRGALYQTVTLQCAVGEFDGVSLKGDMVMLTNKSGVGIAKGSKITVTYSGSYMFPRIRSVTSAAYRDILGKDTLSWGKTPRGATRCTATATISKPYSSARVTR